MDSASIMNIANILNLIFTIMLLMGLAMIFYIFNKNIKSESKSFSFFYYLIFYIPCLILDFVEYIIQEFKLTTNAVYILFVAEIVLGLVYIYIPKMITGAITQNSITLLPNYVYLDQRKTIATSDDLIMKDKFLKHSDNHNINVPTFRKNYGISMWIYLNVQAPNFQSYNKETTIFDYGGGKPKITYYSNTYLNNGKIISENKLRIYYTTDHAGTISDSSNLHVDNDNYFEISIPIQKWNQLIMNYDSNKVDLFVNGNLEKTIDLKDNIPRYLPTDTISVGSEDGLYGAICNVQYYKDTMSNLQIVNSYNLLMNKNPPINNL
jgi:hypothetical protein